MFLCMCMLCVCVDIYACDILVFLHTLVHVTRTFETAGVLNMTQQCYNKCHTNTNTHTHTLTHTACKNLSKVVVRDYVESRRILVQETLEKGQNMYVFVN